MDTLFNFIILAVVILMVAGIGAWIADYLVEPLLKRRDRFKEFYDDQKKLR